MTDEHPRRSASMAPTDLGFTPQHRMVPWLSPRLLAGTGVRVVLSSLFGAYADKREIQAVMPAAPLPGWAGQDELWLDFVADVGDGFGPTYSVATQLAAPTLELAFDDKTYTTRRGRVLVMGGDEVYPTASIDAYQNRTIGPYRAALPHTAADHPHLYALPGNHDWYDGLTAFLRVFCQGHWVGGWQTHQTRSYFAVELPHRWWLWGIDVQFDSYIDSPQLDYFSNAAASLRPGDAVILCSALPAWVHANEDRPEAYRNIDYFERTIIGPTGATVAVALTGDAHHYARYATAEGGCQRITAGGGGAYTSATHHLPRTLLVPPPTSTDPGKSRPPARFELASTWPSRRVSASKRLTVFTLPFRNLSFWALVAAFHLVLLWTVQAAGRVEDSSVATNIRALDLGEVSRAVVRNPVSVVLTIALALGLMSFTKSHVLWERALGAVHALVHVAVAAAWICASVGLADSLDNDAAFLAATAVSVGAVGGLLGSWVMAAYLGLVDLVGLNTNELFASQRLRTYKHFMRLHLDRDGRLTIYPVGLRRTERRWSIPVEGPDDGPWLAPERPLEPVLIEAPITVSAPQALA